MAEKPYQPTEAELEILQVIWELQPVAVRDVYDRIAARKDVGYTTVLKQIQRLAEKKVLAREDRDGTHLYRSLLPETEVKDRLVDRIVQTAFGGSALQMMMHALGSDKASAQELKELKEWLDRKME
jgi:BlaI family penicillinase repressor